MNKLINNLKNLRDSRENFFLQGSKLCYKSSEKKVHYKGENLDILKQLVSDGELYNYIEDKIETSPKIYKEIEILKALLCVYNLDILYSEDLPEEINSNIRFLINRIHSASLENKKRLLMQDYSDPNKVQSDLFKIKVSKAELCFLESGNDRDTCKIEEDLLHELFITFLYTNRLRQIIPNYQLCFAGFKAQISNETETCFKDICPCDTSQTVDYLLLENIEGKLLTEELKSCSLIECLSWLVQIILSLELGVIHFGFTHNNLQPDNIIIRREENNKELKIRYFHNNQTLVLKTNSIAVLTNFELAHVKHKYVDVSSGKEDDENLLVVNFSEHFGPIGYEKFGIYHNETRPFYDIYRIFMWILNITKRHNMAVYDKMKPISKFFGYEYEKDLIKALRDEERFSYLYSTTISDLERSRSLREFLSFVFIEVPEAESLMKMGSSVPLSEVLDCEKFCLVGNNYKTNKNNLSADYTADEILTLFRPRDILERYFGLQKRHTELRNLADKTCKILDSEVCKPSSEEAVEARNEYNSFRKLISRVKDEIIDKEHESIIKLRDDINSMINKNNINISVYQEEKRLEKESKGEAEIEYILSKEHICRSHEEIKGRIAILINRIANLNDFIKEFSPNKDNITLSINEIVTPDNL